MSAPVGGWLEGGGGEFSALAAEYDAAKQINQWEDTLTRSPDAIIGKPFNAATLLPYVEQAKAEGIDVFNAAIPIIGSDKLVHPGITSYVGDYNDDKGYITGQYIAWWAEQNQTKVRLLEVWGLYGFEEWSIPTDKGLRAGIGDSEWVEIIYDSDETGFSNETAYSAVLDALTAHPDINAIYVTSTMMLHGSIAALESVDRWAVRGDPKHMMLLAADSEPWQIDLGLEGYSDCDLDYSCYQVADICIKALYWSTVRGQGIPNNLFVMNRLITPEHTGGIFGDRGEWTYEEYGEFIKGLGDDYTSWEPFHGYLWSDQLAFPDPDTESWDSGISDRPSWTVQGNEW